jgi:integrase
MESQTIVCPKCGNTAFYNGHRYRKDGSAAQRFICSKCCSSFSQSYNRMSLTIPNRHVGALEAKNMADLTESKTVTVDLKDLNGKLVDYHFKMKNQGYKDATILLSQTCLRILMDRGANLTLPETVKEAIAKQNWSQNRKRNVANAYTQFLKYLGLTWEAPICNVTRKLPFIPITEEVNDLIAGCSFPVATFLLLLFETAMRSGEAIQLRWIDVDFERRIIYCNNPEKGSDARIFNSISGKLLGMLNAMPRKNDLVFTGSTTYSLKATFIRSRKRLAFKLQNPRLNAIHFHTLRHFRATLEYHRTKDLLHVQQFLGHREVKNTMLYIQLDKQLFQNFTEDQFITKIAHNVEESCSLVESNFEYVTGEYNDGGKIFRKRK